LQKSLDPKQFGGRLACLASPALADVMLENFQFPFLG
jgi:hypothetical protein